jgi:transposase
VVRPTVAKAVGEIDEPDEALPPGRVRRPGGGRKPAVQADPELAEAVEALVDLASRGDPESPLRWTSKSTLELAEALGDTEHEASHTLVGRLLRRLGYSLQAMAKTAESTQHPDRDAQFHYLTEQVNVYLAAAQAVVWVDTKKKELVGDYKNAGREWQPTGEPEPANVPDFPDSDVEKAIPYGVYDVGADVG